MLNPELARERLLTFYEADWVNHRLATLQKLPKLERTKGYALLGRDEQGKGIQDHQERYRRESEAAASLVACDAEARHSLLGALFGRLAPHVEAALKLWPRSPYQVGWGRRAFRIAQPTEGLWQAQEGWVVRLLQNTGGYPQEVTWLAAWAPYLHGSADDVGLLLAAVLDQGGATGDEVYEILTASARGEHEIGAMGRHVTRALLVAERPDGWAFVERLLVAAQRQEGLRQTILETVDEAHPQAFRRLVRVILDQDLTRFSATVRAADVWFGFGWDAPHARLVHQVLEQALHFLDDGAAREAALAGEDAQAAFLALWSIAFEDAGAAIVPATAMLNDPNVERRFVAAHLLAELKLPKAQVALRRALEDDDLRVIGRALRAFAYNSTLAEGDGFEQLERLLPRLPAKCRTLDALV